MKYKQQKLILEPTSIEELCNENADNNTLAEAMLLNWDVLGSLITSDDYWRCLTELSEFIVSNETIDFDAYKGIEYKELIIKIKNRYFAYYYSSSIYDDECYEWREVKPEVRIIKKIVYNPIGD